MIKIWRTPISGQEIRHRIFWKLTIAWHEVIENEVGDGNKSRQCPANGHACCYRCASSPSWEAFDKDCRRDGCCTHRVHQEEESTASKREVESYLVDRTTHVPPLILMQRVIFARTVSGRFHVFLRLYWKTWPVFSKVIFEVQTWRSWLKAEPASLIVCTPVTGFTEGKEVN